MTAYYNFIQTFYADKEAVNGAPELLVTSLNLYFKSKPYADNNVSGASKPQVTVWLCEVDNGTPDPEKRIKDSTSVVDWDQIACSANATSSSTFPFRNPVILKTGVTYGIVIKLQDSGFVLWENVRGNLIVKESGISQIISPGSQSTTDGTLYKAISSGTDIIKYADRDLKYEIKVARFTSTNTSVYIVNKDYEFFTIDNIVGGFIPGEFVYKQTANAAGNVTVYSTNNYVLGVGTTFQNMYEGQSVIIDNGVANDAFTVVSIESNTSLIIDRVPNFSGSGNYKTPVIGRVYRYSAPSKSLFLVDSNAANGTFLFTAADTLIGVRSGGTATITSLDRFVVDSFVPKFVLNGPITGTFQLSYKLAQEANTLPSSFKQFSLNDINRPDSVSYVLSRSQEVVGSSLYGTSKKSAVAKVDLQITANGNVYTAPSVDCDDLDIIIKKNEIDSVYTEDRTYVSASNSSYSYVLTAYDTEIDRNGLAASKYISKKVSFAAGIYAEDLKVYLTAYRPSNTNIRVYAKLHNSGDVDPFDVKSWTPLELKDNNNKYSIDGNTDDLIEYSYGLPQYPDILVNYGESHLAEYGNAVIATTASLVANLQADDVVRIYKPDFSDTNHEVYTIITSNTTTVTLNKPIRNTNIVNGLGQPKVTVGIDKLKYKQIAFNNIANDNVSRYYTTSKTEFDNFNTMQIKVVLLSDQTNKAPKIEQIQAIGVSS